MALWRPVRWRAFTWIKGTIGLVLVICGLMYFTKSHGSATTTDERSTYVCYQGRCITKATLGDAIGNTTYFQSMENCRLLCGRFGNLWPLPTLADLGNEIVSMSPENMRLAVKSRNGDDVLKYLNSVFDIFAENIVRECESTSVKWAKVSVVFSVWVAGNSLVLDRSTDEGYTLNIKSDPERVEIEIRAKTVYGVRHGFETASQLTGRWKDLERGVCHVYMMTSANIIDKPQYGHRGILIDTARNFIPLVDLKRTLDGMGASKLNVLHWHAVDSHSFPLLINTVPILAKLGAYSAKEVFTEDDIKDLVHYAKLRGVRILMEIDSPSHAGNGWQFGESEGLGKLVLCRNKQPWESACGQPPCGQLNPANPKVYDVLSDLYRGLKDLIPSDDIFHMGGDEVKFDCWNETAEVILYMKEKNYSRTYEGFKQLWSEFHKKALEAWDKAIGHKNTKIVLWTSDLTHPSTVSQLLDKERFIIETWTDQHDRIPSELLHKGYELIYASTDVWYLDHGFWGGTTYHSWKTVYDYRIPNEAKVLGGEVALWSEYADTNSLDNRLWPRSAALAERLWSNPSFVSYEVQYRLYEMRNRLIRRGIKADQVIPQWCYLNEGLC